MFNITLLENKNKKENMLLSLLNEEVIYKLFNYAEKIIAYLSQIKNKIKYE